MLNCSVSEYNGEWGVYLPSYKCYILKGAKDEMDKRCKELNEMEGELTIKLLNGWTIYIHVTKNAN